jgi:B9 domain-containing protein 2
MIKKVVDQIDKSEIDYKAGDFKAEVHFLGQIVGASNILEEDGIFLETFFEHGKQWRCFSQNQTVQTQTGYVNVLLFLS